MDVSVYLALPFHLSIGLSLHILRHYVWMERFISTISDIISPRAGTLVLSLVVLLSDQNGRRMTPDALSVLTVWLYNIHYDLLLSRCIATRSKPLLEWRRPLTARRSARLGLARLLSKAAVCCRLLPSVARLSGCAWLCLPRVWLCLP